MLQVEHRRVLATDGSTRATGYSMSNKIVRLGDTLVVGWLGTGETNLACAFDCTTGELGTTMVLGQTENTDNHCGPALARTRDGHVHAILGAHHRPMLHRRTLHPGDPSAWTAPETIPLDATYPSLAVGPDDTLHLATRAFLPRGEACKLVYMNRPPGRPWSEPVPVAITPARIDYVHYGNALFCDHDGTLHLAFHFYQRLPQASSQVQLYLRSRDNGATWARSDGRPVPLPATLETADVVARHPDRSLRGHAVARSPDGTLFLAGGTDPGGLTLLHRQDIPGHWTTTPLEPFIDRYYPGWSAAQDVMITFDKAGTLYMLMDVKPPDADWAHRLTEVLLMYSTDKGRTFTGLPITGHDPVNPNWLCSLERQTGPDPLEGPPALLYTRGCRGAGCRPPDLTEVHLVTLRQQQA